MSDSPKWEIRAGTLPWTRSCFVCGQDNPHGLQLKSRVEEDRVVLDYAPRESDLGWRRIVHGGVAMTLLDEVMTWAAMLDSRRPCVAAEVASRLRKPISLGDRLRVEGMVAGGKRHLILTESRILDAAGRVMASATGKYLPMSGDVFARCREDFVDSPEAINPSAILDTGSA